MNQVKEAVVDFGGRVSQEDIAKMLGVTPGRVSQVVSEVKTELGVTSLINPQKKAGGIEDTLNDLTNDLELKVLKKFGEKLDMFTQFAKPVELVKCAVLLNGMKRRSGGLLGAGDLAGGTVNIDTKIVRLELPAAKRPELVTDAKTGNIIEAGGRTLVTASKVQVLDSLQAPEIQEKLDDLRQAEAVNANPKYLVG